MSQGWRFISNLGLAVFVVAAALEMAARCSVRADEEAEKPAAPQPAPEPAENPPPEKYTLAFKFRPNQVVRYDVAHDSEIFIHAKDDTETTRNTSQSKRHYKVIAVDEKTGAGDLELSIDWVHMVASFENGEGRKTEPIEFQSDDPTKHPEKFRQVLDSVGRPRATVRFGRTGNAIKVLAGAVAPTAPVQTPNGAPPAVDALPESYFFLLPENAVAIGDAWKERFDVFTRDEHKNLTKIAIQRKFWLTGVNEGRAVIEFKTVIITPVQDPAISGQLIQREISGKIVFDIERGLILSRESGVDRTVVNPFGAKSSMRAKSVYRETIAADEVDGADDRVE